MLRDSVLASASNLLILGDLLLQRPNSCGGLVSSWDGGAMLVQKDGPVKFGPQTLTLL